MKNTETVTVRSSYPALRARGIKARDLREPGCLDKGSCGTGVQTSEDQVLVTGAGICWGHNATGIWEHMKNWKEYVLPPSQSLPVSL